MGRNGLVLWVQEEGPEWPEQGSKRKRLGGSFFFFLLQDTAFWWGDSSAANRAASVVMNFLKFGRLVN